MSKPRYRWWGYIKSIIRNYPALEGRYCQGTSLKERMAVQRSIEQTERMENGKERLQVVDLVFFKQTHTLEGAAMMVKAVKGDAKAAKVLFDLLGESEDSEAQGGVTIVDDV